VKGAVAVNSLPIPLRAYRALSGAVTPLAGTIARQRLKRGKEDAARLDERRGISKLNRPPGPLVWIHGASVGEVLAGAALVERLREMGVGILLTSGTVTSAAIIAQRFPADVIHQFIPYDSPRFVSRFLDHWQPSLGLFMESDLWPNLVMSAAERRIPLIVANGRLSPRSFRRWRNAPATMGTLLSQFEMCLAQSQADADRFAALGSPHVFMTGNLKFDVPAPPADAIKLGQLLAATKGRPIIVAASTHPGEEEMVLDAHRRLAAYFRNLLTVIVPRHPQRGEGIAHLVAATGLRAAMRSRGAMPSSETEIYVADTLGEIGLFYRAAPIVFMGGSFVTIGGHNPIEAIKLGAATVHGPHVHNWAEIYSALDTAGGAQCADDGEMLIKSIGHWLSHPQERQLVTGHAHKVVEELGGALERTMAVLAPYLLQLRLEIGAIRG
jgi:3-deoxy-D-manno-octulosonic-acid transferase